MLRFSLICLVMFICRFQSAAVAQGFGASPPLPGERGGERVRRIFDETSPKLGALLPDLKCYEELTVRRIKTDRGDMVVGVWNGGRIGTFRDLRGGKTDFKTIIYGKTGMATANSSGYAPLLEQMVKFFKTGDPPVPAEETIEIFAFMSAADESKAQDGAAISIPELIKKAQGKK